MLKDGQKCMSEIKKDGEDDAPNLIDPYEELKGKNDDHGVPLHPKEQADYYKAKFGNSTTEAQRLAEANKNLLSENEELKKPKFTQDELSKMIPGYDELSAEQRTAIFNSWSNTQRDMDNLKQTVATMADRQIFEDGFKALVKNEKFSILKKYKEDFRNYAYSDQYRAIDDLMIIARSYVMEKDLNNDSKEPVDKEPVERPGLDTTTRPPKPTSSDKGFTAQELETMRKSDPKRYNDLALAGKLKIKEE